MKSVKRLILSVFLAMFTLSIFGASASFSDSGSVRFYNANDPDLDQEWARQGGVIYIEVEDKDLDVIIEITDADAEMWTLDGETSFYLKNVPIVDRNEDDFVNEKDISIVDERGYAVAVDRLSLIHI